MNRIFKGEEQARDTFICTLVKLFGIEKYGFMEKFCNELEISFSILDDRQVNAKEYFEFLNSIKFDLMEENRNSLPEPNKDKMNIEINDDAMETDDFDKETFSNVYKLLEEAKMIEPSDSEYFSNPVYNTNFYIIFLIVLILNNQMDSARYLYRRLPKPVLKNRTIIFIKVFLSFLLKKDIGKALSVLNKEIENETKKVGENTEKEEDLIEEEVTENEEKDRATTSAKGKDKESQEENDATTHGKGKLEATSIVDNTPEQSSGVVGNAVVQPSVDTPEETMKDVDYDKEEEDEDDEDEGEEEEEEEENEEDNEEEDGDHYDDEDENHDDDNDSVDTDLKAGISVNTNPSLIKNGQTKVNTMTPVDTQTPLSTTDIPNETSSSAHVTKTYIKIKRCSLFIKDLLVCLLETIRKRQIELMVKAYDHILIKEVAKTLDYPEDQAISYLTKNYGWEIDSSNTMFIPKRGVKEIKQEMSFNHINTLIDHLIFLEDSDQLQKVERF